MNRPTTPRWFNWIDTVSVDSWVVVVNDVGWESGLTWWHVWSSWRPFPRMFYLQKGHPGLWSRECLSDSQVNEGSQWKVKVVKRENVRSTENCARDPILFFEVGMWVFITPVAQGKMVAFYWRLFKWTIRLLAPLVTIIEACGSSQKNHSFRIRYIAGKPLGN